VNFRLYRSFEPQINDKSFRECGNIGDNISIVCYMYSTESSYVVLLSNL